MTTKKSVQHRIYLFFFKGWNVKASEAGIPGEPSVQLTQDNSESRERNGKLSKTPGERSVTSDFHELHGMPCHGMPCHGTSAQLTGVSNMFGLNASTLSLYP